ncbi:MAG: nuclease-related domain-containing protein [Pseudomonadota bacterium]|nr:nuclease-related domain-containing protein [Pseudomonadota bacterium]
MILKESDERSGDLAKLTQLASKCNAAQKRRLDDEFKKIQAGSRGEQGAAHVMNRVFGESETVGLLHDLRIGVRGEFAQIDHLVIHRMQGRIWLCETKNYAGRLQCNEHGEWTVWYGKQPKPIPSPIQQARLQAVVLRRWLEENGYAYLDVVPLVLIAPTSSIDRRHVPEDMIVVKWDQFGDWWARQAEELSAISLLKMTAGWVWENRDKNWLSAFGEKLCSAHTPIIFDWESRIGLNQSDAPDPRKETKKKNNVHPITQRKVKQPPEQEVADDIKLDLSPIKTPHGDVSFIALESDEVAIRNAAIEPLIDAVRGTVKGRGRWQPLFKNWIVKVEDFQEVRLKIETRLSETDTKRLA